MPTIPSCIFSCLLLASIRVIGAVSNHPVEGFVIDVPEGWKPIPAEALTDYSSKLIRLSDGKMRETYQLGYQRDYTGTWLVHPYILVQVKENGRVPEGQITAMKQLRLGVERGASMVTNAIDAINDFNVGEPVYDPTNKCIWINLSARIEGVGRVRAVTCGFLTQKGAIFFHAYAKESEFASLAPIFSDVFASVKLREDLRYVSRALDYFAFDFGRVTKHAAVGAAIGAAVGLFIALRKMLRSRATSSTAPPPLPPGTNPS